MNKERVLLTRWTSLSFLGISATFLLAILLVAALMPSSRADAEPGGFVMQNGLALTLDGQPYQFVGTSRYNLLTLGGFPYRGCGDWWTEADITSWLAELKLHTDSNAIRIWAFQLFTADATDFSRLDFVLSEAAAHNIKVIPVLENQWADCTVGGYKLDAWYSSGYKAPYGSYSLAYHDPASPPSAPTDYVGKIVERYRDDPRILMWQLMNEAEIKTSGGGCGSAQTLRDFASDVSAYVKAIDSNHLVSLGTIGGGQCGASGGDYQTLHAVSTIDLCEYHDYGQPAAPIPGDEWNGLQVRIDQCNALNKPLFVGESGIHACGDPDGPLCGHPFCDAPNVCYTKQQRADFFEAKMDAFLNTSAGVGYLIWTYRDNYLMGQADNDPTFRFTSTDPLAGVISGFGDADVDGTPNATDNCPNWPNPTQALPLWPVPSGDEDCDGFPTTVENFVGTNPVAHCGADAWPADINNDGVSDISDISALAGNFGESVPPAPIRQDIAPDGFVDIADIAKMAGFFGKSCA